MRKNKLDRVLTTLAVPSNQEVTVTASFTAGGVTKTATKTVTIVNVPYPSTVAITGLASVNESSTSTYSATVTWDDGSSTAITPTWSVTPTAYAGINTSGLLTVLAIPSNQTVTVTASFTAGGVTKSENKTVTIVNVPSYLTTLAITGSTSVNEKSTNTYSATATWDDGSTSSITPAWSVITATTPAAGAVGVSLTGTVSTAIFSKPMNAATITTSTFTLETGVTAVAGIVSYNAATQTATFTPSVALAPNTTYAATITTGATDTSDNPMAAPYSWSFTTAPAPLTSLAITSGPTSVNEKSTSPYTATATWSDGTTTAVTPTWSVTPATYATINSSGLLTILAVPSNQAVTVTASFTAGGVTKTADKTVTIVNVPCPSTVAITGLASVNESSTSSYSATVTWDDGSSTAITPTWSVTPTAYAGINTSGLLTILAVPSNQAVTVTASYTAGGVTKTADKTVTIVNVPYPSTVAITGLASVNESSTSSYSATVTWDDGSSTTITPTWSITPTAYAGINTSGLLTILAVPSNQAVTVTASYTAGGVTKTANKIVTIVNVPSYLTTLSITGPTSVRKSSTATYTATGTWSDGTITAVTPIWYVDPTTYAGINSSTGVLTTLAIPSDQTITVAASFTAGGVTKIAYKNATIVDVPLSTALWTSIGPEGGAAYTLALAVDPTNSQTIYVGTLSGVFKSTNGGASWGAINSGLTGTSVYSLVIDPTSSQTVYAGTGGGGVFKTTNGGASWNAVTSGLTSSMGVFSLAIDPTNSETVYAGTYGSGVFKTTNGGASWSSANSGLTITNTAYSLAIDPTNGQTIYAGTNGSGVFKSTNGGATWSAVNSGLTITNIAYSLAIDPTNSQTIYAGGTSGSSGVFKSTNGGASWIAVNSGLTSMSVTKLAIATSSQTIYAGTSGGGVFKSTNGGASWSAVNSGLTGMNVQSLTIDRSSSQTVYVGTTGGVFKTTNGGVSWSAMNSVLTSASVSSLVIDPTNSQTVYAGTGSFWTTGGGVFKSTNGGASWSAVISGLTSTYVLSLAIDPSSSQTVYAGTNGGGVFKSTNGGAIWSAVTSGLTSSYVISLDIDPSSSQTVYAGTFGGVFKTTTGGASWSAINSGLTSTYVRIPGH